MKITFESCPNKFNYPFRIIGSSGRYDTITDCDFFNDTCIICADRQMACLYLIEFDLERDSYRILDSITCISNGKPVHFELISIYKNPITSEIRIYGVSYDNRLFICDLIRDKFSNYITKVVNECDNYHGICILDDEESVYVTNTQKPTITKFNACTGTKQTIVCNGGVRMKDVAIINAEYMIALSSDRGPTEGIQKSDGTINSVCKPYDSHVFIYNRNTSAQMYVHTLKDTHIDSCVYSAPFCFVTCTSASGEGYILRLRVDMETKTLVDPVQFPCAGFPHGISIYNNKLAYTSYATSSLYIHDLAEFI